MIKDINQFPAKVLLMKCAPVASITGPSLWKDEILQLNEDLLDTVKRIEAVSLGLAANQIWDRDGPAPAMFTMRWPSEDYKSWEWKTIINPEINVSGKKLKQKEGCLSLQHPKRREAVKQRRANVNLVYQTIDSLEKQTIKFFGNVGMYARIVQHEYDHLQGKLCIDK